jgi:hypothetical protein
VEACNLKLLFEEKIMENTKQIIEINGVKLEIDLRNAKKIDEFKVGDNVKVLRPSYNDQYEVLAGVIVDFVEFKTLPTIQIALFKSDYNGVSLEFINFNSKTEGIEITLCGEHELKIEKSTVIDRLNMEIEKKEAEVLEIKSKKEFLLKNFEKYFN